ncbi:glycosyltransferase family 4 protein [Hoeflea sp.]|uniref:glycosyltransferase family 4 protein n=1 Tax=Hoeflea sp. TaxID=1940281 RepID=UPI003748ADEF
MDIAFYAPLKSPNHPVPSGDRLMAQMLVGALRRKGHKVRIISDFRSFSKDPGADAWNALTANAQNEVTRISALWRVEPPPDLWFCYHPYYKAPDLIGPQLADDFGLTYVTAESSYAGKRDRGPWSQWQACVRAGLGKAAVNICFTERDRSGLHSGVPDARIAMLKPFIDTERFTNGPSGQTEPGVKLISVAMMRDGDKFNSYTILARALEQMPAELPWSLQVIGDGPKADETRHLFSNLAEERIEWLGAKSEVDVAELLKGASIYVWPGCGEAYGLAYLEAQAAGLPVVAQNIAGVPEVVVDGVTGILTPPGDIGAYCAAIAHLLSDDDSRKTLGTAARNFVLNQRSFERAAETLDRILTQALDLKS